MILSPTSVLDRVSNDPVFVVLLLPITDTEELVVDCGGCVAVLTTTVLFNGVTIVDTVDVDFSSIGGTRFEFGVGVRDPPALRFLAAAPFKWFEDVESFSLSLALVSWTDDSVEFTYFSVEFRETDEDVIDIWFLSLDLLSLVKFKFCVDEDEVILDVSVVVATMSPTLLLLTLLCTFNEFLFFVSILEETLNVLLVLLFDEEWTLLLFVWWFDCDADDWLLLLLFDVDEDEDDVVDEPVLLLLPPLFILDELEFFDEDVDLPEFELLLRLPLLVAKFWFDFVVDVLMSPSFSGEESDEWLSTAGTGLYGGIVFTLPLFFWR